MTKKADQQDVESARQKLNESGVDPLTLNSMNRALTLSEGACYPDGEQDQQQAVAEALFGLTIALSHFVAGNHNHVDSVVKKAIDDQAKTCAKLRKAIPLGKLGVFYMFFKIGAWPSVIPITAWVLTTPNAVSEILKIAALFGAG